MPIRPVTSKGANTRVRTGVEKRAPEQLAQVVLRVNPDGSKLTVGDVARIKREGADRKRSYFVGDQPGDLDPGGPVGPMGDAIRIAGPGRGIAAEMQATLPAGVTIDLIRTRAEAITNRLNILIDNGAVGLVLVVLLLFLFLNARTAFWVAAGIPVSMLTAIALMYAFGLTINMVSLFALIITLGIVVDDAIVVGEHADARVSQMGRGTGGGGGERRPAHGAAGVFGDLDHDHRVFRADRDFGRFGDLIADIPFTVIAVLAASLVECFLILPNHMAHALKHSAKEHWYDLPLAAGQSGFRLGARDPVPAVHRGRDLGAVSGVGGGGSAAGDASLAVHRRRREMAVLQRARARQRDRQFRHGARRHTRPFAGTDARACRSAVEAVGRDYDERFGIEPGAICGGRGGRQFGPRSLSGASHQGCLICWAGSRSS